MSEHRFRELFQRYVNQSCTRQEELEFMQLMNDAALEKVKQQLVEEAYDGLPVQELMTDDQANDIFNQIIGKQTPVVVLQPARRFVLRRIAVAAAIVFTIGIAGWYFFFNKPAKQTEVVQTALPNDVKAPEVNRAMLTLANGQRVYLDSAHNGTLVQQGGVEVVKLNDGQIVYKGSATEPVYNTLFNPRGSRVVDITLADGSKVWLNAGSSVTYPVAFTGNERKVTITGEAYFEVVHDAGKPFYVTKGDIQVQVLGTHFNVNAYDDESAIRVTLLEGSVRVKLEAGSQQAEVTIKPGEQAELITNKLQTTNNIDIEQVMAWKNGLFSFTDADLPTVMRQLARWYNVQVEYAGTIPKREFNGEIGKTLTLAQVLNVLSKTRVNYRIEGENKIVITP